MSSCPNHVHLLISLQNHGNDAVGGGLSGQRPTDTAIPKLVSSLKRHTDRVSGMELWQSGYYDHVIRCEQDYQAHWKYIDGNPAKWAEDEYYEA
jgi:REP element-mobilizing transposase RayT